MSPEHTLYIDLLFITWGAFLIAVAVFGLVRHFTSVPLWNADGNVPTRMYHFGDLIFCVVFFLLINNGLKLSSASVTTESEIGTLSVAASIFSQFSLLVLLIGILMAVRKINLIEAFGLDRLSVVQVVMWSVLISVCVIPLVLGVGYVTKEVLTPYLGEIPPQPMPEILRNAGNWSLRTAIFVAVAIVAPVVEEVFYRGYLYSVTKRYTDRFFAAVFSALVFSLIHPGVISYAPLFAFGVLLALVYELSGSLWIPIAIHSLFNIVNVVLTFVLPAP